VGGGTVTVGRVEGGTVADVVGVLTVTVVDG
jgi:hypothetical protein